MHRRDGFNRFLGFNQQSKGHFEFSSPACCGNCVGQGFFRQTSQKHIPHEEVENASANLTAMVGSMRPPLCSISKPAEKSAGVSRENSSGSRRFDRTPTKIKGKGFAKAADSELLPFSSPPKHGSVLASTANVNNINRFGWTQSHDTSSRETNVTNGRRSPLLWDNQSESYGDTNFTPRSLNYTSGTPRPIKNGGKASSNESKCSFNTSISTKSVSRAPNQGASARAGHASKTVAVASAPPTEVPHFELNEDPTFWMDHNVQVLLRIRPLNSAEVASQGHSRCLKQETAQTITFLGPPETRFTFDHVACEAITQEMFFKVSGLPMVENCMSGYNSCMFAYGQSGSGKTHTMLGDINELGQRPSANHGMTPRIFEYLFARIRVEEESHTQEQLKYVCKCSFLEIYNEKMTDLLEPSSTNLQLREDVRKGVHIDNLTEIKVKSVQDIVQLLFLGAANRRVAATNMNRESSQSHSVFTCIIESHWEKDSMTNIRYGRLNLVDLAGLERQKSSGAEGEQLKEAANINKSLSTLGLVITILVDVANGKQRHVPYRDSRLTFLLQDSLGGNSKTIIIANISPSICSAHETLSTLKFAQRAKFIQNNAIANEDASGDIMALQLQIQQLKEELSFFKHENISRSIAFRSTIFSESKPSNGEGNMTIVPGYNVDVPDSLDLLPNPNAFGSPRISSKKLKSLEATLAGALRREQGAETATKRLEAEIEKLNRLVRQREEDTQCSKMMLRFREDKIRRLESVADGLLSSDVYLVEEKKALFEELQLLRGRLDRNPELTQFSMENIRLLDQLRKYQDFYGGEIEVLLAEGSELRDQLLEVLEGKFEQDKNPCTLSTPQVVLAPELACIARENDMLKSEIDNTRKEMEDCRNHLSACLEARENMLREIDELHVQVEDLKTTCYQQQNDLLTLRSQSIGGANVEKEDRYEQIINDLKARHQMEMELRTKIEDGQVSVKDNKHDLQEKTEREQQLEMRHSEEIMQLQLPNETVLEEERLYQIEGEERVMQLSQDLEAAESVAFQPEEVLEVSSQKGNLIPDMQSKKAEFKEENFRKMEDKVKKSREKLFEVETKLCLSFGAIEELAATQCKLQVSENNLIESSLTTEALMLEKSTWEIEKETLFKDAADIQVKLKLAENKVDALTALINDFAQSEKHWRNERQDLFSKAELLHGVCIENIHQYTSVLAEKTEFIKLVQQDLLAKNNELSKVRSDYNKLEMELADLKEILVSVSNQNSHIPSDVEDLLTKKNCAQELLSSVTRGRDCFQVETLVLNEQLEACQVAEARKTYAEEKTKLLERLVEEVLCIVNALERQVGLSD